MPICVLTVTSNITFLRADKLLSNSAECKIEVRFQPVTRCRPVKEPQHQAFFTNLNINKLTMTSQAITYYGTNSSFWDNIFLKSGTKEEAFSSESFAVLFGELKSIDSEAFPNGARALFYFRDVKKSIRRHPEDMLNGVIEYCATNRFMKAVMNTKDFNGNPKLEVWFDKVNDSLNRKIMVDALGKILGVKVVNYVRFDDKTKKRLTDRVTQKPPQASRPEKTWFGNLEKQPKPSQSQRNDRKGNHQGGPSRPPQSQRNDHQGMQLSWKQRLEPEDENFKIRQNLELHYKLTQCKYLVKIKEEYAKDLVDNDKTLDNRPRSRTTGTATNLNDYEVENNLNQFSQSSIGKHDHWWFPEPPKQKPKPVIIDESDCKIRVDKLMEAYGDICPSTPFEIQSSTEIMKSEIESKEHEIESLTELIVDKVKPKTRPRNFTTGTAPETETGIFWQIDARDSKD